MPRNGLESCRLFVYSIFIFVFVFVSLDTALCMIFLLLSCLGPSGNDLLAKCQGQLFQVETRKHWPARFFSSDKTRQTDTRAAGRGGWMDGWVDEWATSPGCCQIYFIWWEYSVLRGQISISIPAWFHPPTKVPTRSLPRCSIPLENQYFATMFADVCCDTLKLSVCSSVHMPPSDAD
ncbi:hypothetical protein F4802DRAFT_429615 [Xylaria palmicola]|nr:hypothetical protein F4802DRAFT_429615 [Xylaria palmicola]